MIAPDAHVTAALAPVRDALLAAARADAQRLDAQAQAETDQVLAAARQEAQRLLAEARQRGGAEAEAAVAAEAAGARRRGRAVIMRARREAYESLVTAARAAVAELRGDPAYPATRDRLAAAARAALGPDAGVREAAGGGVVAEAGARRVDLSLSGFAERAAAQVAAGEAM
ncbi:MAG TPA: hypothetical protein VFM54_02405 [Micromonosporaceae bacterium]|nr:hypothetical protein [Micromonosporaceae bacterium]